MFGAGSGMWTSRVRMAIGLIVIVGMISSAAGKDTIGRVFRCEINGSITYSDSACEKAPDKKEIATGLRNSFSSGAQKDTASAGSRSSSKEESTSVKRKPSDTGRSNVASDAQSGQLQRCKNIAVKLEEIKKEQRSRNGLNDIDESLRLADERQRFEKEAKNQKCAIAEE